MQTDTNKTECGALPHTPAAHQRADRKTVRVSLDEADRAEVKIALRDQIATLRIELQKWYRIYGDVNLSESSAEDARLLVVAGERRLAHLLRLLDRVCVY